MSEVRIDQWICTSIHAHSATRPTSLAHRRTHIPARYTRRHARTHAHTHTRKHIHEAARAKTRTHGQNRARTHAGACLQVAVHAEARKPAVLANDVPVFRNELGCKEEHFGAASLDCTDHGRTFLLRASAGTATSECATIGRVDRRETLRRSATAGEIGRADGYVPFETQAHAHARTCTRSRLRTRSHHIHMDIQQAPCVRAQVDGRIELVLPIVRFPFSSKAVLTRETRRCDCRIAATASATYTVMTKKMPM